MSLLNHQELKIVMGVGPLPGDTYSAEAAPVAVNLMDDVSGFALDEWMPQIPALKGGGIWLDSNLANGRQMIGGGESNVTETIVLSVSASTYETLYARLRLLAQMRQAALDFHRTDWQIQPVYLKWWAHCAPGPQYALIYSLEYAAPEIQDSPLPQARLTLTVERECYWRGIPPTANPKLWTFRDRATVPLADYDFFATPNLVEGTVSNKLEWAAAALGAQSTLLSQNYLDIPGTSIPGDAPALVQVSAQATWPTSQTMRSFQLDMGVSDKRTEKIDHTGVTKRNAYVLAAADAGFAAGVPSKVAGTSTTGLRSNGSSVNYYFVRLTGVGGGGYTAITWGGIHPNNYLRLDRHLLRGQYAVFARIKTPAANFSAFLQIDEFEQVAATATVSRSYITPVAVLGGPSGAYGMNYLGQIMIPFADRRTASFKGYGPQIVESVGNFSVILFVGGAPSGDVDVLDVILIPIEAIRIATSNLETFVSTAVNILYDNTGYSRQNDPVGGAFSFIVDEVSGGASCDVAGGDLVLCPHTDQQLHMILSTVRGTLGAADADPRITITVRLNIVPRWVGPRDE